MERGSTDQAPAGPIRVLVSIGGIKSMRSCLRAVFAVAAALVFSTGVLAECSCSHDHASPGVVHQAGYAAAGSHCSGCDDCGCDSCRPSCLPLLAPFRCNIPGTGYPSYCRCGCCQTLVGEMLCDVRAGARRFSLLMRCTSCGLCRDECQCGSRLICLPLPRLKCLLPVCRPACADDCCDTSTAMEGEIIGEQVIIEPTLSEPQPATPRRMPETKDNDPFRDDPNQNNNQTRKRSAPRATAPASQPVATRAVPADRSVVKRTAHQQSPTRPATLVPPRQVSPSTLTAKPLPLPATTRPAIRLESSANRLYVTGSQQTQGQSTIRFR